MTILPATEEDVRLIMNYERRESNLFSPDILDNSNCWVKRFDTPESPRLTNVYSDSNMSSRSTTAHSTPKPEGMRDSPIENSKHGLILPIYVYDCALASLIEALIDKAKYPRARDIYQDHTFKLGQDVKHDFVNLKVSGDTKPSTPEPKSEDSDNVTSGKIKLIFFFILIIILYIL